MYEKLVETSRNNGYTTGNVLDYLYHKKACKLIDIDLPRQGNNNIPQKIIIIGKLEENDRAIKMFIAKKQQKIV